MKATLANLLGLLSIAAFLLLIRWGEHAARLPIAPPEDYARHEGRVIAFAALACLALAGIGATLGLPR